MAKKEPAVSDRRSGAGRPRSETARLSILQSTFELLCEVGFDRMTFDAIAADAGVSKATIYRWYESKEDLVAESLISRRRNDKTPNTGSLAGDVAELVHLTAECDPMVFDRRSCAMTISAIANSERIAEIYWTQYLRPARATAQTVFVRAKERGELSPSADPEVFFDLLHGALLFSALIKQKPNDMASEARTIAQQLLDGFAK